MWWSRKPDAEEVAAAVVKPSPFEPMLLFIVLYMIPQAILAFSCVLIVYNPGVINRDAIHAFWHTHLAQTFARLFAGAAKSSAGTG